MTDGIKRGDWVRYRGHIWEVLKIWQEREKPPGALSAVLDRYVSPEDVTFCDAPLSELEPVPKDATAQ